MPYPGNVHKYIMPVLLMSSCNETSVQEHLGVPAAACAALKRLPMRMAAIHRASLYEPHFVKLLK